MTLCANRFAICLLAFANLIGCNSPSSVPPTNQTTTKSTPKTTTPIATSAMASSLARSQKLWDLYLAWGNDERTVFPTLQPGLQSLRDELGEIPVTTGGDPLTWSKVDFGSLSADRHGGERRFAAFRFRSPLSIPADMHWAFAVPEAAGDWRIVPLTGTMAKFEDYKEKFNVDLPALSLPAGNCVVLQELLGSPILPGVDYVICYKPAKGSPDFLHVGLRLTPHGTHRSATSIQDLAKAVGLSLRPRTFPQTKEGLREAFDAAQSMMKGEYPPSYALADVLESVKPMLPELKVSTEAVPPIWNLVTPSTSFRFHAVRFTCPLDVPADLQWCHVVEYDQLRWGIAPVDGYQTLRRDYRLQVDCPITGIKNAGSNLAVLQNVTGGEFEPKQEYLLWFMPERAVLSEIDVALKFTPKDTVPANVSTMEIGAALGLEIPAVPSAERVAAALKRAQQMMQDGRLETKEFNQLLRFATPGLPTLNAQDGPPAWNWVELGTKSGTMAAYRIHPGEGPQEILLAVARPKSPAVFCSWIHPQEKGAVSHFMGELPNVQLDGIELPNENILEVSYEQYWDRQKQGPFPIIIFSPSTDKPTTLYAAMRTHSTMPSERQTFSVGSAMNKLGLRFRTES